MLCISCTCESSIMTYNVSNSYVIICRMGWFVLVIEKGRGKGRWSLILEGLMQNRVSRFWTSRGWHLEKDSAEAQPLGENKTKDFTCYAKRIFTFSSEVFSLTFRKALSPSSSSSSLVWMAFLKLKSNWNKMIIRNCLKPFLLFYKSHNTCILNINITRTTSEE